MSTRKATIIWEDPPSKRGRRGPGPKNAEWADALKERPGEWARVREYKSRTAAQSTASSLRGYQWTRGYEFKSSGCCVYARFVGAESES